MSEADYLQDSGVYKCVAHNQAGTAEAMATVTIHNPNNTVHGEYDRSPWVKDFRIFSAGF